MINIINFPGFLSLLTLVFVTGKVFGFLAWGWFWIFSPLWVPAGFLILALIVILLLIEFRS